MTFSDKNCVKSRNLCYFFSKKIGVKPRTVLIETVLSRDPLQSNFRHILLQLATQGHWDIILYFDMTVFNSIFFGLKPFYKIQDLKSHRYSIFRSIFVAGIGLNPSGEGEGIETVSIVIYFKKSESRRDWVLENSFQLCSCHFNS